MDFKRANIDRAIVMTQYDLRGFCHPLSGRMKYMKSGKSLCATTHNLLTFADAGNPSMIDPHNLTFAEYRKRCIELSEACEGSQKEAIQLIVREIVKQNLIMLKEVANGKRKASSYILPIEEGNSFGNAVLSLIAAFKVSGRNIPTLK